MRKKTADTEAHGMFLDFEENPEYLKNEIKLEYFIKALKRSCTYTVEALQMIVIEDIKMLNIKLEKQKAPYGADEENQNKKYEEIILELKAKEEIQLILIIIKAKRRWEIQRIKRLVCYLRR